MKDLVAFVWDFLNNSCLYFQNTLSTKWLIISGIIALAMAIVCAAMGRSDEDESNYTFITLFMAFPIYFSIFAIGLNHFEGFVSVDNVICYISILLLLLMIVLYIIYSVSCGKILYSIASIVCLMLSAFLFSKFIGVIGLCMFIIGGILGGGSSYLGTFTDKNGNSYDIFKKY